MSVHMQNSCVRLDNNFCFLFLSPATPKKNHRHKKHNHARKKSNKQMPHNWDDEDWIEMGSLDGQIRGSLG